MYRAKTYNIGEKYLLQEFYLLDLMNQIHDSSYYRKAQLRHGISDEFQWI